MIEKRGNPEIKSVRGKLGPAHGQKAKISFSLYSREKEIGLLKVNLMKHAV